MKADRFSFSADRATLLTLEEDGGVRVYRLADRSLLFQREASEFSTMAAALAPDASIAFVLSEDGRLEAWWLGAGGDLVAKKSGRPAGGRRR